MYSFHILFLRRHIFDNKKLEMAKCQNFTHSSNFETDAGQQGNRIRKCTKEKVSSGIFESRCFFYFIMTSRLKMGYNVCFVVRLNVGTGDATSIRLDRIRQLTLFPYFFFFDAKSF